MKVKELETLLEKVIKKVVRQELQRELTEVKLITSALREFYLKESNNVSTPSPTQSTSKPLSETQKDELRNKVMPERFTPESVGGNSVLAQLLNETVAIDENNYQIPNPDFAGVDTNSDLMNKLMDPSRNKAILQQVEQKKGSQGNIFE